MAAGRGALNEVLFAKALRITPGIYTNIWQFFFCSKRKSTKNNNKPSHAGSPTTLYVAVLCSILTQKDEFCHLSGSSEHRANEAFPTNAVIKREGGEFRWSSGQNSALPLQGARVWFLVGWTGMPHGMAKEKVRRYWWSWVLWSVCAGQMSCDLCRDTLWSGSLGEGCLEINVREPRSQARPPMHCWGDRQPGPAQPPRVHGHSYSPITHVT